MIHAALIAAMAVSAVGAAPTHGNIYQFTMKSIDGKEIPLEDYKGKVLLVVNVASKCGLTPQYDALEKLYKSKKNGGFAILGFPANEFGSQEPGTDAEIKEFCTGKYDVTFPMFSKIVVKGEHINPLYQWLTEHTGGKEIAWNFAKFLIGRQGQILERFDPKTKPDAPEITKAIDEALASKA
jgi:glutathione peroxidase